MVRRNTLVLIFGLANLLATSAARDLQGDLFGGSGFNRPQVPTANAPAAAPLGAPIDAPNGGPPSPPVIIPSGSPPSGTTRPLPPPSPEEASPSPNLSPELPPKLSPNIPTNSPVFVPNPSAPSTAVFTPTTCSITSGASGSSRSVACYSATAAALASACGLRSTNLGMISFSDSYYSSSRFCATDEYYELMTSSDRYGFVDNVDECLCACVTDEQCLAVTYQPNFMPGQADANCFIFFAQPSSLNLCQSSYGGASAEVD